MSRRLLASVLIIHVLLVLASVGHAQYMFLDTNGDGIGDPSDVLSPGTNVIDVWLWTNTNANGSPATCITGDGTLNINSYQVLLRSSGGLTYGTWTNRMPFYINVGDGQSGNDRWFGWASSSYIAAGKYRLGTLSVNVTGSPTLNFVASTDYTKLTAFGSPCSGNDFDNTLKFGTDWFDARGLSTVCPPVPGNTAPDIQAPATASADEGQYLELTATGTDPDAGEALIITAFGQPTTLGFVTSGTDPVTASLSGTLGFSDAGSYSIRWKVFDSNCASDSATTLLTVNNIDRPVALSAPSTKSITEGAPLVFYVYASDPDGEPISYLQASGLPPRASFAVNQQKTQGTFSWAPGYDQSGHYVVTFTAATTTVATAYTSIDVLNVDQSPAVVAPSVFTGIENALVTFVVSASDPDADPITTLYATNVPAGGSFTAAPDNTTGTFSWTPSFAQSGSHVVSFYAQNNRSGTASTLIQVQNVDRAPNVVAPATVAAAEGTPLQFQVSASDPDNESYTLTTSTLPPGAAFMRIATGGEFDWVPSYSQAGTYSILFSATNALTGSATTSITVSDVNRAPSIAAPNALFSAEGTPISFSVTASDPEGDAVSLGLLGRPVGSTFVDLGTGTGSFNWTPTFSQAGTYNMSATAQDVFGVSATPHPISITVDDVNRAPLAVAGGPYTGVINRSIEFDASGSSDPDGDVLACSWAFGDGTSGLGRIASHSYSAGGTFSVALTVSDGTTAATAATTAHVQDVFDARVFTTSPNGTIRLGSGKATWYVETEPVSGAYDNTSVILSTITLSYAGKQIGALAGKAAIGADKDGNGVDELVIGFAKTDLRTLFADLPRGTSAVTVVVEGALTTGGHFRGSTTVDVVNGGGAQAASVSPNPLNPTGVLTFRTEREGYASVSLYDAQGRLCRTLLERTWTSPGYHDVRIDGRSTTGSLATGVYFYRVDSPDGPIQGRITILK